MRVGAAFLLAALIAGCTWQQQLLLSLLPDGTFTMPLSKLQRLSTRNQDRIDQLSAAGDWPALAAFARDNLKRDPASGDWWLVLGSAQARSGDWRGARTAFAEAVRYAPDSADAWAMLAQAEGQSGDRTRAIRTLEQAQGVTRDSPVLAFFLAEEYRATGRFADAERGYIEALRLEPAMNEALYGLALTQARAGNRDAAMRTVEALRERNRGLAERAGRAIEQR